jgi:hypothetical protein
MSTLTVHFLFSVPQSGKKIDCVDNGWKCISFILLLLRRMSLPPPLLLAPLTKDIYTDSFNQHACHLVSHPSASYFLTSVIE